LQEQSDIKLVVLDLGLPDMDGMDVLDIIKQRHPELPVIILTGSQEVTHAVAAMKAGAYDFLTKPLIKERIEVAIKNSLKTSLLEKELFRLKRQEVGAFGFDQLIGHDNGLLSVVKTGRKAASSDIPVLLTGDTGTGKEVFARAIHGESHRVGKPFIAVNCGAIPENLVEGTLFGHEKGAFTGAVTKSIGKFREAEGGTIFLDEIGDLPLDAQAKLLRVLQQKEISPIGASRTLPTNVRVISATHRNLET
jgi:DNA-binding NtrC family response regulator